MNPRKEESRNGKGSEGGGKRSKGDHALHCNENREEEEEEAAMRWCWEAEGFFGKSVAALGLCVLQRWSVRGG